MTPEELTQARATAALFKDRDPPPCFALNRESSIVLARAFLQIDAEREEALERLQTLRSAR